MIESGHDPGDRLTLEAVRLYLSRTRPDELVALHISNREYWLEPVVARIARELKLAARVWHDDREGRPGTRESGHPEGEHTADNLQTSGPTSTGAAPPRW